MFDELTMWDGWGMAEFEDSWEYLKYVCEEEGHEGWVFVVTLWSRWGSGGITRRLNGVVGKEVRIKSRNRMSEEMKGMMWEGGGCGGP